MKHKVLIESLGCAKNLVDSEIMMGLLTENNYEVTTNKWEANVVIVNTCGFIETAKQESIDVILDLAKLKEQGNCEMLVVCGCLAERYSEDLLHELPEVDAVVGTGNFPEIIQVLNNGFKGNKITLSGNVDAEISEELPRLISTPKYTAYLKISDGCDNCCTYCIIPKLRGKYRSRKMEAILSEAQNMVKNGVREIIIIAQDTTSYGIDNYKEYKLSELLKELCKIEELKWIRLLYCYPEHITDALIETITQEEKICKYIDIPIQHSNDDILKMMNRRTNKEHILKIIKKLRDNIPEIHLRTSLIVGFPGETRGQFEELKNFVKDVKFDRLGVFSYSQEENTPAANFKNQLSETEKQKRQEIIMSIQREVSNEKNKKKIGKLYDILVEEKIENEDIYLCRTEFDSPEIDGIVYLHTNKKLKNGDFVEARISDTLEYDLLGEMADESS